MAPKSRLLSTAEAAELLSVSSQTILNWIEQDAIPYIQLPSKGRRREFRVPLRGLLESLEGNYDLGQEIEELDASIGAGGEETED